MVKILAALVLAIGLACWMVPNTATTHDDWTEEDWDNLPAATIQVRFKGVLVVGCKTTPTVEVISAMVRCGDREIELDWQESKELHDELLWWSIPRHPDLARDVQAEVSGTLVFKALNEAHGMRSHFDGMTDDTPVPVVMVDSLRVQLAGRDGRRKGHQPDRPRVIRESK